MDIRDFLDIPEERRLLVRILLVVIVFFLLVLVFRSCAKPGRVSTREYLRKLSMTRPEAQVDGLVGLANRGVRKALPRIEEVLAATPDERVRKAAVYAVFKLDREKRFPALLESPREDVCLMCLQVAVEREGEEKALPLFEKVVLDESRAVREVAFETLSRHPGERTSGIMLSLVENSAAEAALRVEAARYLAAKGDVAALVRLRRLVEAAPPGAEKESPFLQAVAEAVRAIEARIR